MSKIIVSTGIDMAMDKFDACIMVGKRGSHAPIKGTHTFPNTAAGFKEFLAWMLARAVAGAVLKVTMEATGSYYEGLAYFINSKGIDVCVELPTKVKYYAKSLNIKGKNDKIDAKTIASLGLSRDLRIWKPMEKDLRSLRDLMREILSLKDCHTAAKNQMHAMDHSNDKLASVSKQKQKQLDFYTSSIADLEAEVKTLLKGNTVLKKRIENVATIKGVGIHTALVVIAETGGFELFTSIRQVVSYSGLDPIENSSGNHIGKTRISKNGSKRLRTCLYMPSLSAGRHDKRLKDHKDRIIDRNPTVKMKGQVATMRKLLVLIYTLWKTGEKYDPNYKWSGAVAVSGNGEN